MEPSLFCTRCERPLRPDDITCPKCGQLTPNLRSAVVVRARQVWRARTGLILGVAIGVVVLIGGWILIDRLRGHAARQALQGVWAWADRPRPEGGANFKLLRFVDSKVSLYNGVVMRPQGNFLPQGVTLAGITYTGDYEVRGGSLEIRLRSALPNDQGMYLEAYTANGQWLKTPDAGPPHLPQIPNQPKQEVRQLADGSSVVILYEQPPTGVALEGYAAQYPMQLSADGSSLTLNPVAPRSPMRTRVDSVGPGIAPLEEVGVVERITLSFLDRVTFQKNWTGWRWEADLAGDAIRNVVVYPQ